MARIEKTVFISYRRTDVYTALAVYENLKNQGYDVFFDYRSISAGDFEQIITSNIRARAHFLLILTPTALDRCNEPGDWLRREIEIAIDERRNIVPLFFKGFRFGTSSVSEKLTGKLKSLSRYNGLNIHEDYFDEAMHRLSVQYLNIPLDTVLHPVSTEVQKVVEAEQVAADQALEEIEDVQELVKQTDKKPIQPAKPEPIPDSKASVPITISNIFNSLKLALPKAMPFVRISTIIGLILILFWIGSWTVPQFMAQLPTATITSALTDAVTSAPTEAVAHMTQLSHTATPSRTSMPQTTPTEKGVTFQTSIPVVFNPWHDASDFIDNYGVAMRLVSAGEFTMGSNNDDAPKEKPVHAVDLDAFYIDKYEVTNGLYKTCVDAGVCELPHLDGSYGRPSYYDDLQYTNYPVVSVDWFQAKAYCEWRGGRLPTEAEWEKAARGTDARRFPWGDKVPNDQGTTLLNHNWNNSDTTQVGSYFAGKSAYGVFDMAGNVLEWVNDWYGNYESNPPPNPKGPNSGQSRVARGGAWWTNVSNIDTTERFTSPPDDFDNDLGIRCAMDATP